MVENNTQQKPEMFNKPNSQKKKIHIKLLDPEFDHQEDRDDTDDE